jgi:hypothetical protein
MKLSHANTKDDKPFVFSLSTDRVGGQLKMYDGQLDVIDNVSATTTTNAAAAANLAALTVTTTASKTTKKADAMIPAAWQIRQTAAPGVLTPTVAYQHPKWFWRICQSILKTDKRKVCYSIPTRLLVPVAFASRLHRFLIPHMCQPLIPVPAPESPNADWPPPNAYTAEPLAALPVHRQQFSLSLLSSCLLSVFLVSILQR